MRAIRVSSFGGPENLKCENNVPIPSPAAQEVLIKVAAAGVNPVDTFYRSGNYSPLPTLPYTPGLDAAGVVTEVGADVKQFKVGDRVFTSHTVTGACAEYATAEVRYVGHLADNLSFEQGAGIGVPYFTAYRSLHIRAHAQPGEVILVHGASGAVGIAALQMGRAFGLRMIGTAGTEEGMELVKQNGADLVFNHREAGYIKKIKEAVGAVDVVLEMAAQSNLQRDLALMNPKGRIVVVGCTGKIEINPRLTMGRESCIMGVALSESTEAEWQSMHAAMAEGQKSGWLRPHIGKIYPLEESAQAQNDVIHNTGTRGRLVIDVTK